MTTQTPHVFTEIPAGYRWQDDESLYISVSFSTFDNIERFVVRHVGCIVKQCDTLRGAKRVVANLRKEIAREAARDAK